MSGNTPKTMSQGLMGMKFMQRAAAKSSPSSPSTPNGPPTKKSRLSNGTSAATTSDYEIIQAAKMAEEKKHQAALDKAAQHVGETKWVLSFKDPLEGKRQDSMNVRQTGFAEIDADDDSEDEEDTRPIRMQFGGGVKKKAETVPFVKAEESESESESASDDYDSDDPAADLIRETKREMATEKRESRKESQKGTPGRPDQDRNHNGLTSISGSRRSGGLSGGGGGGGNFNNVECFKCQQKGHISANCPNKNAAPRGSAGRGRGKGRR